jgi:hypothetical protein
VLPQSARGWLSSRPCTWSNLPTMFLLTRITMYRHASIFAKYYALFISFSATAEAPERVEGLSVESLHSMIKDQGKLIFPLAPVIISLENHSGQRIRNLEEDNRNLNNTLQSFLEEFNHIRSSLPRSVRRNPISTRAPT